MPFHVEETLLFDPVAIEKLREVGGDQDQGFVAEMALLFLEESGRMLAELRGACDGGDFKKVAQLSHSLKSSSATLGLMGLRNACVSLELNALDSKAGHNSSSPKTLALAAAVLNQFEQAIPLLKRLS